MKYTSQTALALACLATMATANELKPNIPSRELRGAPTAFQRNLQVGEWAGRVWDNVVDAFDGDDDENGDGIPDEDTDVGGGDGLFCNLVESAIGMSDGFGVSANCSCEGSWNSGITVQCNFDECATGESEVCGRVDLKFTLGGEDGPVDMVACADFENDDYRRTCFSYELCDGFEQSCKANYGGQPCECSIENGICLSVDCSRYVPGGAIDTCQSLSMGDQGDIQNFFPDFAIFQPDFELQAENVPWADLDFENLDFDNFDIRTVEWGSIVEQETWVDLIGENPTFFNASGLSGGVCKMMYQAANLSNDLGLESSCSCEFDEDKKALELSCDFEETCTGEDDPLCGAVSMNLTYASLTQIYADVCITYRQFPETCYSYGVPFIDVPNNDLTDTFIRDCAARYGNGDNNCKCTIDDNWCLKVDCSDFEPLAITDQCQVIDLAGTADDPSQVILNFETPDRGYRVSDGEGGVFRQQSSVSSSGSSSTSATMAMVMTLAVAVVGQQIW